MRKWSHILAGAAGLAALSIGTLHAQNTPGALDPARVEAGTYQTDPDHSLVGWEVNHFGFNDYFGLFGDVAGTLTIDPADLSAARVDVTIPISSVTVVSAGLKDHLLRPGEDGGEPDFFGPQPEPARFVSTAVQVTGEDSANITGDLTLNGVTRPVTIEAEFVGAGMHPMKQVLTIGFEGETTISRSAFGIDTVVPLVSDEVELDITIAFEKQ